MPTPTENRKPFPRARVWPAAALPAGLSALLALAIWLFTGKVAADQERADGAALRLESYARLEAGELAARASAVVREFASARRTSRQGQERNLRLEVRGVMDAVHRVLTVNLEKSRAAAAARRDVGVFPPGFDGVRGFLEIAPATRKADRAADTLRSIAPEFASLLPAGCSLAVVEDNSREILAIGGGVQDAAEATAREAMTRDFLFDDGGANRLWTIRVEVTAADAFPVPGAAELAGAVTESLGATRLDGAVWRGWLLGPEGQVAASFPPTGDAAAAPRPAADAFPPFIDKPREWVEIDGLRLVWLETADAADGSGSDEVTDFVPAVSVSIDRPPPPLDVFTEFKRDTAWCATLTLLAGLTLAGWVWFLRTLAAGQTSAVPAGSGQTSAGSGGSPGRSVPPAPAAAQPNPQRRLVRDPARRGALPEGTGVIVADLDGGTVTLAEADGGAEADGAEPPTRQPRAKQPVPSGSLYRLQAIHRGGQKAAGSRALDGAKSAVLRELAKRVRPVLRVTPERTPGRGTERIAREVKKVQLG